MLNSRNGELTDPKAGGDSPLATRRPPDLINQFRGEHLAIVDRRVLTPGLVFQMIWIHTRRVLAKMVEKMSYGKRSSALLIDFYVSEPVLSPKAISFGVCSSRPDPAGCWESRIPDYPSSGKSASIVTSDVQNGMSFHPTSGGTGLVSKKGSLAASAKAQAARILHRVTSFSEVPLGGWRTSDPLAPFYLECGL